MAGKVMDRGIVHLARSAIAGFITLGMVLAAALSAGLAGRNG
jgi:hypothetical protein